MSTRAVSDEPPYSVTVNRNALDGTSDQLMRMPLAKNDENAARLSFTPPPPTP